GAKFAVRIGPVVPDRDTVGLEVAGVGLAAEKPDQLVDDRLEMHPLGRYQRETPRQIEAHLVAEDAERAGAGAVALANPLGAHTTHELEILLHGTLNSAIRARP